MNLENDPIKMCFYEDRLSLGGRLKKAASAPHKTKEHKAHSTTCGFILLKKSVDSLSTKFLKLQKERQKFIIKKTCVQAIHKFEEAVKLRRAQIIRSAMGEE